MSFLNTSHSFSSLQSDLHADHGAGPFRPSDEMNADKFISLLRSKLLELEEEVHHFDEAQATKKQFGAFLVKANGRIQKTCNIIQRLKKDRELLRELPEEFLIDADLRIQTVRRILHLKKMSPEQRSSLSQSIVKTDQDDESECLISERNTFNDVGLLKIDLENSHVIDKKLRKIEDKFEYVNMICLDLNNLLTTQSECIDKLDNNYGKSLENTTKAKLELTKLQEYKESHTKRNCVIFLALSLMGLLTYFFMSSGLKFNYHVIH